MKVLKTEQGIALMLILGTQLGCGTGDDRLREKARIEGSESAQTQVDAENENRKKLVAQMELDLEKRHRFFDAISGSYGGVFRAPDGVTFRARFTFTPSFPRYPNHERSRSIEELAYELNNLYVSAHVVEWFPREEGDSTPEFAFGCVYEQVRPDLVAGKIVLTSANCNATYTLYLSHLAKGTASQVAKKLAALVTDGKLASVKGIVGEKQTVFTSRRFKLWAKKIND